MHYIYTELCNSSSAGQDYQPVINVHLGPFGNNNRHQCFNVNILNDTQVENPENFTVNVQFCHGETPPERVGINPSTGTTTIIDDDGEFLPSFHLFMVKWKGKAQYLLSCELIDKGGLSNLEAFS